jgi:hypothetical protein
MFSPKLLFSTVNKFMNNLHVPGKNEMLFSNENKGTFNHFYTNYFAFFILFMPNYLSIGCVFSFILALFRPPGSGSRRPTNADPFHIRIRLSMAEIQFQL